MTAWVWAGGCCGLLVVALGGGMLTAAPLDDLRPLVTTRRWT